MRLHFFGLFAIFSLIAILITLIRTIHLYVLVPVCGLPLLKSTTFCQAVAPGYGLRLDYERRPSWQKTSNGFDVWSLFCHFPFAACNTPSSSYLNPTSMHTSARVTQGLKSQFDGLLDLMGASQSAPQVARDMTNFRIAMDDLVTLVSLSEIRNKAALLALLEGITAAGLSSSHHLLSYTEDLHASITIILATAEDTLITIAASPLAQEGLMCRAIQVFGLCDFDPEAADKAFIHTLQIFELLIHDLTHANSLTAQSLISLESKINSVKRLIDEETNEVSEEIGDLLGHLWTILGGNRGHLHHARSRYLVLNQTGVQTKAMKKVVLDVQLELAGIQKNCDRLRSYAAAPLLASSTVPKKSVVFALSEGCRKLKARVEGVQNLDTRK